jgi:hypothetical protein
MSISPRPICLSLIGREEFTVNLVLFISLPNIKTGSAIIITAWVYVL